MTGIVHFDTFSSFILILSRASRTQTPGALSEAPLRRVLTTSTKRKIIMRDLVHCLESDHLLAKSTFVTKTKLLLGIK